MPSLDINPYRGWRNRLQILLCPLTTRVHGTRSGRFEDRDLHKAAPAPPAIEPGRRHRHRPATDPYQPAERRFDVLAPSLRFSRTARLHVGLITKATSSSRSGTATRIARRNVLSVHITVTTVDEKLARLLERALHGPSSVYRPFKTPRGGSLRGRQPHPSCLHPDSDDFVGCVARAAANHGGNDLRGRSPAPAGAPHKRCSCRF